MTAHERVTHLQAKLDAARAESEAQRAAGWAYLIAGTFAPVPVVTQAGGGR